VRPNIAAHGDIACNIALQLSKRLKANPRVLAEQIAQAVRRDPRASGLIEKVEIAGPGFINLYLDVAAKQAVISTILREKHDFGRLGSEGKNPRVIIEFVSANPTGPLHVGHGRQAVLGDVLANIMASQGQVVHREFYYNDAGAQIYNLACSVQARVRGLSPGKQGWPEAGYNGEYIADIARDYIRQNDDVGGDDLEAIRRFAVAYLRREQDNDLQALGVKFDEYYLESSLYEDGRVHKAVQTLIDSGKTYEENDALWLSTTAQGDDKDRVMRKSDGSYTYFVPDLAYHVTKWERGFTTAINIQGTDHHGTIARVRAGLQYMGLGIPKGYPAYILHKMVTIERGGQEIKISKRAGSYVTVRDLIEWSGGKGTALDRDSRSEAMLNEEDEVIQRGRDAVRFFLISRKADTEFVFDIDVALKRSDENPVYYVQYAHARICSVLTQWKGDIDELSQADVRSLTHVRELALLQVLAQYPAMLARAAHASSPHDVAFYLRHLAGEFHAFYNANRVLVEETSVRTARLALIAAVRQVLANGLGLLGVSAPVQM
jgi:arginyl-tRNA synthetase